MVRLTPLTTTVLSLTALSVAGALAFTIETPQRQPVGAPTSRIETARKLALPPQAVNGFLNAHGQALNTPARDVLEDLLLSEAPPEVDMSTMSVYDIANAYLEVSDIEELEAKALQGRVDLNEYVIERAETGFARDTLNENYVKP